MPKNKNDTDDPRSGFTLCCAYHWAFDAGLFTLTPKYNIVVSPLARRANSRKFELLSLDQQRMQIPRREVIAPHRTALEWHQAKVFRAQSRPSPALLPIKGESGRPSRFCSLCSFSPPDTKIVCLRCDIIQ